jgi:hypothetical protein
VHRVKGTTKRRILASNEGLKKDPNAWQESQNSASCTWQKVTVNPANSHVINKLPVNS